MLHAQAHVEGGSWVHVDDLCPCPSLIEVSEGEWWVILPFCPDRQAGPSWTSHLMRDGKSG